MVAIEGILADGEQKRRMKVPENRSLLLLLHFVIHIGTGAVLFAVLALVSWGLYGLTVLMDGWGAPRHIFVGARYVSEVLFIVDWVLFLIYGLVEVFDFVLSAARIVKEKWG